MGTSAHRSSIVVKGGTGAPGGGWWWCTNSMEPLPLDLAPAVSHFEDRRAICAGSRGIILLILLLKIPLQEMRLLPPGRSVGIAARKTAFHGPSKMWPGLCKTIKGWKLSFVKKQQPLVPLCTPMVGRCYCIISRWLSKRRTGRWELTHSTVTGHLVSLGTTSTSWLPELDPWMRRLSLSRFFSTGCWSVPCTFPVLARNIFIS
jgi:hypothetical protein